MKNSYMGKGWTWENESTVSMEKVTGRRNGAWVRKIEEGE